MICNAVMIISQYNISVQHRGNIDYFGVYVLFT